MEYGEMPSLSIVHRHGWRHIREARAIRHRRRAIVNMFGVTAPRYGYAIFAYASYEQHGGAARFTSRITWLLLLRLRSHHVMSRKYRGRVVSR